MATGTLTIQLESPQLWGGRYPLTGLAAVNGVVGQLSQQPDLPVWQPRLSDSLVYLTALST